MAATVLHTPSEAAQWLRERVRGSLHADSRKLKAGDGFVAWPGAATDGRQFIAQALAQGAAACLAEEQGAQAFRLDDERVALYPGLKAATGPIASEYCEHPSRALKMVAVTGTNGKTSTAWWLAQALTQGGLRCATVGTLGIGEPPQVTPTGLTTPDPVLLQSELRRMADSGVQACVMEASSIGVVERRLDGLQLDVAVLTNFTQDHLDYHDSMQAYWQAKAQLFDWPGLKVAVLNVDDAQGAQLHHTLKHRALDVWTVGIDSNARLQAFHLQNTATGQQFDVVEGQQVVTVQSPSIGRYNVSNLLGVIAVQRALGVNLQTAAQHCAQLLGVPGRLETFGGHNAPLVVVDYAHTPDALDKALLALTEVAVGRGGALWCVFGCGGDRDPGKRPMMAAVAERSAQHVVITSDNPRSEKPENIIEQICKGLQRPQAAWVQVNRATAIALAVSKAHQRDVVLLAGKGHEPYQEIAGQRLAFSDIEQAQSALAQRRVGA
jgi:UDP-N-acetylmuramyl-tripeptide synthetase